jgi:tRNA nucleotidyltransferase (CCA-adding enzyme)
MGRKVCGVAVFDGQRVLLVQTRKGNWGFPKGGQHIGETDEQTALRELKEETGIVAEILPDFRETGEYYGKDKGVVKHSDLVIFVARAKSVDITPQKTELITAGWFHQEEAVKKVTHENTKRILEQAIRFIHG